MHARVPQTIITGTFCVKMKRDDLNVPIVFCKSVFPCTKSNIICHDRVMMLFYLAQAFRSPVELIRTEEVLNLWLQLHPSRRAVCIS